MRKVQSVVPELLRKMSSYKKSSETEDNVESVKYFMTTLDSKHTLAGSTADGTRCFYADEFDFLLICSQYHALTSSLSLIRKVLLGYKASNRTINSGFQGILSVRTWKISFNMERQTI